MVPELVKVPKLLMVPELVTVTPGAIVTVTPEFIVHVSPAAIVVSEVIVVSVVNVVSATGVIESVAVAYCKWSTVTQSLPPSPMSAPVRLISILEIPASWIIPMNWFTPIIPGVIGTVVVCTKTSFESKNFASTEGYGETALPVAVKTIPTCVGNFPSVDSSKMNRTASLFPNTSINERLWQYPPFSLVASTENPAFLTRHVLVTPGVFKTASSKSSNWKYPPEKFVPLKGESLKDW